MGVVTSITSLLCYFPMYFPTLLRKLFHGIAESNGLYTVSHGQKKKKSVVFQAECYQSGLVDRPTIKRETSMMNLETLKKSINSGVLYF